MWKSFFLDDGFLLEVWIVEIVFGEEEEFFLLLISIFNFFLVRVFFVVRLWFFISVWLLEELLEEILFGVVGCGIWILLKLFILVFDMFGNKLFKCLGNVVIGLCIKFGKVFCFCWLFFFKFFLCFGLLDIRWEFE